ncbi:MAG: hypothetical protein LBD06_09925, partial [Candidatus Accumulibacter sp.]|nr:hypothetical protein [Accumulibacter sp.]
AAVARAQWKQALHMLRPASPNWRPPVIGISAFKKEGIVEFWDEIERYREITTCSGEFEAKRKKQALDWMWSLIETGLHHLFKSHPQVAAALPQLTREVARGQTTPNAAAHRLLSYLETGAMVNRQTPCNDELEIAASA